MFDEFVLRWKFVRSETMEILNSLNDEQLQFKPDGEEWKSILWQFGCIGRTQLVYAKAARTGTMNFEEFRTSSLPDKDAFRTLPSIKKFLNDADKLWLEAIKSKQSVQWPFGKISMALHISNLIEHERIHHGEFISYFTLAGFQLPEEFKNNWGMAK
jgi:hypothetical protein